MLHLRESHLYLLAYLVCNWWSK